MSRARAVASLALVVAGLALFAASGAGASTAEAAVACADADTALAPGVVMSCAVAGAPTRPDDPDAGTRTYSVSVDLTASGVSAGVVMANDTVFQPVDEHTDTPQSDVDEVVSSMVEGAGATVGVNGGYFDIFQGGQTPYTGAICGGAVVAGEIWKSPPVGDTPAQTAQLDTALYQDAQGAMHVDHVDFAGAVTVLDPGGTALTAQPLAAVNDITAALPVPRCPSAYLPGPSSGEGITLLTPRLGPALLNPGPGSSSGFSVVTSRDVTRVALAPTTPGGDVYTVEEVTITAGATSLAPVPENQLALLGSGSDTTTPGGWLTTLTAGETVRIDQALTVGGVPTPGIQLLLGGVAQIVAAGDTVSAPVGFVPPSAAGDPKHAETVVGVDATGTHVTVLAIDRSAGSPGVWWRQAAQLLDGTDVQDAILFDGGGSTTLAARLPGQPGAVAVVNTPEGDNVLSGSDGQRFVGDGLVFTGAALPQPAPAPTPILPATGAAGATAAQAVLGALLVATGAVLSRPRRSRRRS